MHCVNGFSLLSCTDMSSAVLRAQIHKDTSIDCYCKKKINKENKEEVNDKGRGFPWGDSDRNSSAFEETFG